MNEFSKLNVFGEQQNNSSKKVVLKINSELYNESFDFEVINEEESFLSVTLYKLVNKSLIGRCIEVFVDSICVFDGIVQSCDLVQSLQEKALIKLECSAKDNNSIDIKNVDFNSKAKDVENIFKVVINKTTDNFEYIRMTTELNAELKSGDIINFENNLYAIETVVYIWCSKGGFHQEVHAINGELHSARYLG